LEPREQGIKGGGKGDGRKPGGTPKGRPKTTVCAGVSFFVGTGGPVLGAVYPKEVKGIEGLDPTVPEVILKYPKMREAKGLIGIQMLIRTGWARLMPEGRQKEAMPLLDFDELTDEEKKAYRALFFRRACSASMLREIKMLQENAEKTKEKAIPPDLPLLFFYIEKRGGELVDD